MESDQYDVLIIGAGAAGLVAALELALTGRKTAVIEAKNKIGGRAVNLYHEQFERPVEAGAEFIHGNLELTLQLLKKAGISYHKAGGELWQKTGGQWHEQQEFVEDFNALNKKLKALPHDISVKDFIDQYLQEQKFEEARFTLKNYVEGYYAADIARASSFALRKDLNESDEEQYRVEGGYAKLFDHLFRECNEKGVHFYLSQPAVEISWEKGNVSITIPHGTYTSKKVLITVPVGVLQAKNIRFLPSLPLYEKAAGQLGFGGVVKTVLQLKEPFWKNRQLTQGKNLDKLGFVFSDAVVPTWWTRFPEDGSMLTGWSAGPHADELKNLAGNEILEKALQSLSGIFDINEEFLQQNLVAWHVANWVSDPFCLGGYSYEVVNGSEAKKTLLQPVENTLWFTGEGLFDGAEIGTVNAALVMGRNSAHEIIASFKS